ncbi:uncharacterized protein LOC129947817 [Eupeodes corollae]|uniref:uncharacterized protein LOC129942599 n=1 Tax=Eupeodes corollae TaxID=290404 RepID=UPI0024910E00|nr:uncharacterized protein LOC129942599 [Eupeodes corollae]XP_055907796.1 uncharacterized protein LOC129942762 [Eupeodes corollae]XP_055914491.1 uncharacterized protein LOC129947817 [Eupeodes corollae]
MATNKKQMETLVDLMEKNPDIASGYSKKSKEEVTRFWKIVDRELNSTGPPVKSIFEWKKVWSDKKKYIKNKMSENLKMKHGTGGGPFREYKFSALDEAIIKLCGMTQSVEGSSGSRRFGLPSCSKRHNENQDADKENLSVSPPKKNKASETIPIDDELELLMSVADDSRQINSNMSDSSSHKTKPIPRSSKEATETKRTCEFLERELELHRELCDKVGRVIEKFDEEKENNQHQRNEIKISLKKIYHSIDRLCDHQKLALEEQKRSNFEMEKLRRREIEAKFDFKQKLLAIEEAKLERLG